MSQPNRVGKPAHTQGNKQPQANCCFVRTAGAVSLGDMSKILNNILTHAGGEQLFRSRYDGFKAFVQRSEEDKGPADFNPFNNHLFPGETVRLSLKASLDSVDAKIKDLQKPKGQVSASPPPFLQNNSLVMVVGTEKFLIAHAYVYLETHGLYRQKLFKLIFDCLSLSYWTPGGKVHEHSVWVDLSNNKHFKVNVNFLAALARKSLATFLSTEELVAGFAAKKDNHDVDDEEGVES